MKNSTLLRLVNPTTLAEHLTVCEILSTIIVKLHIDHHQDPLKNEHEGDAKTLIQMLLSKAKHLVSIGQGIELVPNAKNTLIDPTVLIQIERNIFETVVFFNSLYILPDNLDQQKLIYNLWWISTLNFKQRFHSYAKSEQSKLIVQDEIDRLDSLINEVRNSDIYINGNNKTQSQIDFAIDNKKYWIVFEANGLNASYGPQVLCDLMTRMQPVLDKQYTLFSLFSHPSKNSVNVFNNIYRDNSYQDFAIMGLRVTNCLLSMFIHDYIKLFPNSKQTFESFPIEIQALSTFYNNVIRETDTSTNDSWQLLERLSKSQ